MSTGVSCWVVVDVLWQVGVASVTWTVTVAGSDVPVCVGPRVAEAVRADEARVRRIGRHAVRALDRVPCCGRGVAGLSVTAPVPPVHGF